MSATRSARKASPAATGPDGRRVDVSLGTCTQVRLRKEVTFIVAGVFLRPNAAGRTEVLLIQEAAKKCRGEWFLPAGRVEPGETIEAAVKREVEEEAGVKCDVKHLLSVEVSGGDWYRMAFYCQVTGGELKTVPDKESLQAKWHEVDAIKGGLLKTRGTCFFRLIDVAMHYRDWKTKPAPENIVPVLNFDVAQEGLFVELVVVKRNSNGHPQNVLVHSSVTTEAALATTADPFPVAGFNDENTFSDVISKLWDRLLEDGENALEAPSKVLATWCLPSPADSKWNGGLRVRVLTYLKASSSDARITDPALFRWQALNDAKIVAGLGLHPDAFRADLYL
ncbi:CBN-NDX-1 protein [Aphelenchoides avenae]|nr:CBN-NDX-1 protein [Aphelenchus avenae]